MRFGPLRRQSDGRMPPTMRARPTHRTTPLLSSGHLKKKLAPLLALSFPSPGFDMRSGWAP